MSYGVIEPEHITKRKSNLKKSSIKTMEEQVVNRDKFVLMKNFCDHSEKT